MCATQRQQLVAKRDSELRDQTGRALQGFHRCVRVIAVGLNGGQVGHSAHLVVRAAGGELERCLVRAYPDRTIEVLNFGIVALASK